MAAGNQWKHLEFTLAFLKRLFSLFNLKTFAQALLSSELENIRRIDTFVHETCYPKTMPMSADICLKVTLPDKGKNLKFLILIFSDVT